MKGGIVYSNFVTTVSPSHADEALYGDGGSGLGGTLKEHQDKFRGVLNGVDHFVWNPETDPLIPAPCSTESIARKYEDKEALRDRFWIRRAHRPVVAYVGRLDEQKGMHLVHHALFYTLARGGQFVLMGDAHCDDSINDHFRHLKDYLNDHPDCHLEIGYREELAHLVYAGADLLIVPSMFEPCGLAPLIAMRYGTVPVVRATGMQAAATDSEWLDCTWGHAAALTRPRRTSGGHRPGSPRRSGPVWCLCEGHRPPVRASAGTNFAASTVPQPLARS